MPKRLAAEQNRSKWAWYFYDFGNSAYASIILLAVYSAFFKNVVVGGAEGTRLWALAVGIASAAVAALSPLLGAIADFTRFKKQFMILFTLLSVVFTGLLFFVRAGDVAIGMIFFILAEIGYRAGQLFYDALLTDVSTVETIGSISGKGWAFGMIGGILSLVIVFIPIRLIGDRMIPFSFPIAALFFLFSAIPTFIWVKERKQAGSIPRVETAISLAFKNLAQTFRSIKSYKEFAKYTIAFLFYNNGLMMLMEFASIIGATLYGLDQMQLIYFVILIQITGAFGALLFGKLADKYSSKTSALIALMVLSLSLTGLFFTSSEIWFFVIGGLVGFFMSAAQTVSRSIVGQLAPDDRVTEFYGFLSVAGSAATFIGPFVFGTLTFRMHNWYVNRGLDEVLAEKNSLLWGVGSIIAFLLVGSALFLLVKRITIKKKHTRKRKRRK
ncbi:MAG: MFS transporter [Oscillospiraceae bacterium]|nr:MFS transporter [Oscillospiraceae bacterium]